MSEKKTKQLKKEEQTRKEEGEKPLFQTVITVLKNGNIQVQGFPSAVRTAIKLVSDFNEAMMMYFVEAARNGKLDLQGKIIKSPILGLPGNQRTPQQILDDIESIKKKSKMN